MIKIEKIGIPPKQLTEASILFGLSAKPGAKMKNVESLLEEVLQKTGDVAEGYFDDIMATWGSTRQHEKDVIRRLDKGKDWSLFVFVTDKYFMYLNEGAERKVVMSDKFRPKTKVRSYLSGTGVPPYKPVAKWPPTKPYPRIAAREWTTQMAEDLEPILKQKLESAFSGVGRIT